MKLYYSPSCCSLAPHIVAVELGIPLKLVKVDLKNKKTAQGDDFTAINPKGYVPALELDDGRILTEGPAIVQYLAELEPEKALAGKANTFERAKVQEWLNFIATEIHKGFGPLFYPNTPEDYKKVAVEKLGQRFSLAEQALSQSPFIVSERFTVVDAYLFTVLRWCGYLGVSLEQFPHLQAYIARIDQRESVKKALAAEGSI